MGRFSTCWIAQLLVGLCAASPVAPQANPAVPHGMEPTVPLTQWPTAPSGPSFQEPAEYSAGRVALSSLVVPGAGQWLQGQRRWIAYLAVEATAVLFTLERRKNGSKFRDSYRDLAWSAARGGDAIGRIDLDFTYFERMANFTTSGVFDRDPSSAGVQPETDPATYNGSVWELAQGLFLRGAPNPAPGDVGYAQALEYYTERGYDDRFLWDWSGQEGARAEYRRFISKSDEAFRTATVLLGVAVANHVVSAVDALVSTRSRTLNLDQRMHFEGTPVPGLDGRGTVWELRLRLTR